MAAPPHPRDPDAGRPPPPARARPQRVPRVQARRDSRAKRQNRRDHDVRRRPLGCVRPPGDPAVKHDPPGRAGPQRLWRSPPWGEFRRGATMTAMTTRELNHRTIDGLDIRMLWDPGSNLITITVNDSRTGESFEVEVGPGVRPMGLYMLTIASSMTRELSYQALAEAA